MARERSVLVLGASGGIGGEVARQLQQAGWSVRALKRGLGQPRALRDGIEWIDGDALDRDAVVAAATGCDVVVHAVNPPGYRRWSALVLPMVDNAIAAATAARATVVLPGTVYNYGPEAFPVVREDSPQRPRTRKGAIRVELERRLEAAARSGDIRVIIVRAGDFFGPRAGNNWFTQGMIKPGRPVTRVSLPAAPGVGHQFSYLPDVARAMVQLLARRDELEPFACFHMAGHWDGDGTQVGQAIQRVVLRRSGLRPGLAAFPWWLMRLAAPFVTTLRELLEMRYLWRQEVRMDNSRLVAVLGAEPRTPLDEAIERTLEGAGCLPAGAADHPRSADPSATTAACTSRTSR
jgi:nucleoside-diphosphate-sugar epimerase